MLLFAQDPTTAAEWVSRFPEMLSSFGGVLLGFMLLPPVVIGLIPVPELKKVVKYIITGVIGGILILLATVLDYGFLHGAKVWASFLAWGLMFIGQIILYVIPYLKPIWDAIEDKFNIWKPTPTE